MFQKGHQRVLTMVPYPAIRRGPRAGKSMWPAVHRTRSLTAENHLKDGEKPAVSGFQASPAQKLGGNRLQFSYYTIGMKIPQTIQPSLSAAGNFAYDFGAITKPWTNSGHRTVVGRSIPRSSGRLPHTQRGRRTRRGNPTARSLPNPTRHFTALNPKVCSFEPRH